MRRNGLTNENHSFGDLTNPVARPPAWGFCGHDRCVNKELFHNDSRWGVRSEAYYVVGIGVAIVRSKSSNENVCPNCTYALYWSRQYKNLDNETARYNVTNKEESE